MSNQLLGYPLRKLGQNGPIVSSIGLGCMGMSDLYGPVDEDESIATLLAALDAGISLLDTADFYGMGHNELLIRDALRHRARENITLSVKFGALRDPAGRWSGFDNRPVSIKNFLAYSLRRLNTEYIDIYRPARIDPSIPIEEIIGGIARMVKLGYVRYIGLSEVSAETIRRAHAIHPITDVQIEYSLFSRSIEEQILPTCRELGISITAYGVLGRGLLSGHWHRDRQIPKEDFRAHNPRFNQAHIDHNLMLVESLRGVAAAHGMTVAQLAIGWLLSRGEDIVPLIGARKPHQLEEALELNVSLSPDVIAAIEQLIPKEAVAGARYDAAGMSHLDSER